MRNAQYGNNSCNTCLFGGYMQKQIVKDKNTSAYFGIDVLHTRRYVLQDTQCVSNPWYATIEAVKSIALEPDLRWIYGDDELCEFIEGSLQEISTQDIIDTDVVINHLGQEPLTPTSKPLYPAGARYFGILAKHKCRYVVMLSADTKDPLEATIDIVKRSDNDGASDTSFPFGHKGIQEFVKDSFSAVSPDEIDPNDILIDYEV